jgi:hypothetical protein
MYACIHETECGFFAGMCVGRESATYVSRPAPAAPRFVLKPSSHR